MGGSSSKTTQLNESITNIANEAIISASSSASGIMSNTQIVDLSGTNTRMSVLQDASIDISLLQDATVNSSMQAEIINKIIAEVSSQKSDFPQITSSKTDTEITNIVENNVSSSLSMSSDSKLVLEIGLLQKVISRTGSVNTDIDVTQLGSAVGKVVNNMSGSIITDLVAGTELEGKSSEVTTFFGADLVDSVGNAASNVIDSVADMFGLDASTVLMIIVLAFIGLMGAWLTTRSGDKRGEMDMRMQMMQMQMQRPPQMQMQHPPQMQGMVAPGMPYASSQYMQAPVVQPYMERSF